MVRLFSAPVLQDLAKHGHSRTVGRLVGEAGASRFLPSTAKLADVYERSFAELAREASRYEYAYRAAVTQKILLGRHSLRTASMLTEFRVERSKADLVILNGTSTVYEIKSERDNLERMAGQLDAYYKVFPIVNVVSCESHASAIVDQVPEHVGVIVLNRRYQLTTLRHAVAYQDALSTSAMLDCLQIDEAVRITEAFGIPVPAVPNTRIRAELQKIFAFLSPSDVQRVMISVLKQSRSQLSLNNLTRSLPPSLRPLALTAGLRRQDEGRLISALGHTLQEVLLWDT